MRKHRLFGVVIAVLIGLGVFTQQSTGSHHPSGAHGAGVQLAAAKLPADSVAAPVSTTVASDATTATRTALLTLVAGRAEVILSSPFGPQALVADADIAQVNQRTVTTAYLTALAQQQAQLQATERAYLVAMAPKRPVPPPTPVVRAAPTPVAGDPWAALRQCESNGNYGTDTGNGYYGAYQFSLGTWRSLGLGGLPSQAPPAVQDQAAQRLQAARGWGQWPSCARRLGLL